MNAEWRKQMARERFIIEGDRVFDTQEGRYYIRERVAVERLNEKLEKAAIFAAGSGSTIAPERIRHLKENA